jgi:hypothetical protein
VSAKVERARKKKERVTKKNKKEKGIKRGDSQVLGKGSDTKVKRTKRAEEMEERELEEALDPEVDQEMTDVQGPFHERSERGAEQLKESQEDGGKERTPETEPSNEEIEAQRLKGEQTEQEGRKMGQESAEKGLKRTAPERAKSHTLSEQEGQKQEKEPESQELTDLLKGVQAQCTEVKESLRAVVEMRGKAAAERMPAPKEPRVSSKLETPRGSASGSLKTKWRATFKPLALGIVRRPACCSGGNEGCASST